MQELIMAYQGEMALKGLNRKSFEAAAMKTIRKRLEDLGRFKIYDAQSTIYVEPQGPGIDMEEAYSRMQKVFGIAALSRAAVCPKDFEAICSTAVEYLAEELKKAASFKVVARRSDKTFPMGSMELAAALGERLLAAFPHLRVDVRNPDCRVFVEVRDFAAYLHPDKVHGAGGLPTSTSGKASVLLSGGIDSPVAAWMMAKRGLTLQGVHFASPPYTSERAKQKVVDLAYALLPWTGPFKLFVVPFTAPQVYIRDHGVPVLFTVLMRRSMMRVARALSEQYGADALITGESLAQVASQTLKAIACTDAAQPLPVLRPLIGMDKSEITQLARQIETYEISIQPYEDCCTIFTPPHPKTRPTLQEVLQAEERMPQLAELEAAAAEGAEKIAIEQGARE